MKFPNEWLRAVTDWCVGQPDIEGLAIGIEDGESTGSCLTVVLKWTGGIETKRWFSILVLREDRYRLNEIITDHLGAARIEFERKTNKLSTFE